MDIADVKVEPSSSFVLSGGVAKSVGEKEKLLQTGLLFHCITISEA